MFENIDMMMRLRKLWSDFSLNHPGVAGFIGQAGKRGLGEGTVIDLKITYPDGSHLETNMRVNAADMDIMERLKELSKKK